LIILTNNENANTSGVATEILRICERAHAGNNMRQVKVILMGNAGAGKSTMARRVIGSRPIPILSLDEIAWNPGVQRKPLPESLDLLNKFLNANGEWVIEGCYGDLIEAALPHCTELRFLNPGAEACVAHCHQRPWEPEKFSSREEQDAMLKQLVAWVKAYDTRDDEFGLKRHREIFDQFDGPKREFTSVIAYTEG
jgi:adenylate kinase family enzyme